MDGALRRPTSSRDQVGRISRNEVGPFAAMETVSGGDDGPVGQRIYEALRSALDTGSLRPGNRLPTTRALAQHLCVNRKVVTDVYRRLIVQGYLRGHPGSGTYVEFRPVVLSPARREVALSQWAAQFASRAAAREVRPFAVSPVLNESFRNQWYRSVAAAWRMNWPEPPDSGAGLPELREQLAEHAPTFFGISCPASHIVVTGGGDWVIARLLRLFAQPSDQVLVDGRDDDTRNVIESVGLRSLAASLDADGCDVEDHLQSVVRAAYLRPSSEGPLGIVMTAGRRYATLQWAKRTGALIIEDDVDRLVDSRQEELPSLKAIDTQGVVVAVAALWRLLMPGCGIGFAIAPPAIASAIGCIQAEMGGGAALPLQAALASLIRRGRFAEHIRRTRTMYSAHRRALTDALLGELGDVIASVSRGPALQLIVRLRRGAGDRDIADAARARGLQVDALSEQSGAAHEQGLLLGYGSTSLASIPDAVAILGDVIRNAHERDSDARAILQ